MSDQFEGSTPRLFAQARDELFTSNLKGQASPIPQIVLRQRANTYVSCWRMGNEESEAMWRLYCPHNGGVAIKTTYHKLAQSVRKEDSLFIGCVRYLDYENEGFQGNTLNLLDAVMHKRHSFAHEREVRIVKADLEWVGQELPQNASPGTSIPWSIDLIEEIYVNAYAPEFFYAVVRSAVKLFAPRLSKRVKWSRMRSLPVF